jgi:hypothetical protein
VENMVLLVVEVMLSKHLKKVVLLGCLCRTGSCRTFCEEPALQTACIVLRQAGLASRSLLNFFGFRECCDNKIFA